MPTIGNVKTGKLTLQGKGAIGNRSIKRLLSIYCQ